MTTTQTPVLRSQFNMRCTEPDKEAFRTMAKRLGCDDASDAFRKLARWLSAADDGVVRIVKHEIEP